MLLTLLGRIQFARALRHRRFALLWSGQAISSIGDGAFLTALAWQVLVLTHSATAMGITLVAQSIPMVIFMLVGGVVADRLPRRLTLLWSDGGRAVVTLIVAALGFTHHLQFWQLVALSALFGLAEAFFRPAFQSIPPELVPEADLPSANALTGFTRNLSLLIGPAVGAALVGILSPAGAFAFDGVSFVVSAIFLALMGRVDARPGRAPQAPAYDIAHASDELTPAGFDIDLDIGPGVALAAATQAIAVAERSEAAQVAAGKRTGVAGFFADIREGVGYVTGSTWLWLTIAIASLGNVAFAPMQVSLPRLVQGVYHQGVWLLGASLTAFSVGSIIATVVVGQFKRIRHRGWIGYLSLMISSGALALYGAPVGPALGPALLLISGVVAGAGIGVFEIIWATTMQQLVPPDKLGRVTSVDWLGSLCLQPIGLAVVGALTDVIGPSWIFIAGGAFSVLLTGFGLLFRDIRQLD